MSLSLSQSYEKKEKTIPISDRGGGNLTDIPYCDTFCLGISFLSAMSSSRSDVVTQSVSLLVSPCVTKEFFMPKELKRM